MTDANTQTAPAKPETAIAPAELQETQKFVSFENAEMFAHIQRVAKCLCASELVPEQYRGEKNLSNTIIAVEMAWRMKSSPFHIMQQLHIIQGKPSWSSQYIISKINTCGKFSPLRYDIEQLGSKEVEYEYTKWVDGSKRREKGTVTIDDMRCVAWATELRSGERLESPPITIEMAVKEGWYMKDGSKWKTMPIHMIRFRAAAFFGREYIPEVLMGMSTDDEVIDITPIREDRSNVPMPTALPETPETPPAASIRDERGEESQETPEGAATANGGGNTPPPGASTDAHKVVGNDALKAAIATAHPDDLLQIKSEVGAEDVKLEAFLKLPADAQMIAKDSLLKLMRERHAKRKGRA